MRVALAQLNQTVGDFDGNTSRIIEAARGASADGARVLLTPELSVTGYPPEDLLLRRGFYDRCRDASAQICQATADLDLYLVIGLPVLADEQHYNAAQVLYRGEVIGEYYKRELPNYAVFDEQRYFKAGKDPLVVDIDGVRFGIVICEDFWFPRAPRAAREAGAQVLLALNASPFHMDKQHLRIDVARRNVSQFELPILTANLVGGQDELVFDGQSFILDGSGELVAQAIAYKPAMLAVDIQAGDDGVAISGGETEPVPELLAQVYGALVLGVRDYLGKSGFKQAVLGLSGGIDSALTLAVAVDALGADNVRAVMMPSRYTSDISLQDAKDMAQRVGVRYDIIAIRDMFEAFKAALAPDFAGLPEDTTEENIQARIRGVLLMSMSNKHGSLVLTTGNKSELAVGYCTLYGDMAGGFAVIKDVAKTLVYRLARWRNEQGSEVIPDRIITRPPSAELRDDQTDQDSLPEYDVLDGIMQMYMEDNATVPEILAAGYPEADVRRVVHLIRINEYKRRQSPVGIRVTHRAFGRDWRYPITSRYTEKG